MKKAKHKHAQASAESASELFFWAKTLTVALVVLILVNTFFLRISSVSGGSMNPTLEHMDQLLLQISGYNTQRNPAQRGDVVVIISEDFGTNTPLVKRVIGVAGDVIDITEEGYITVNGILLQEDYISAPILEEFKGSVAYPYTVTTGHVFVVGDNRNASFDSRDLGELPCSNIIGKAVLRIWPLSKLGGVE